MELPIAALVPAAKPDPALRIRAALEAFPESLYTLLVDRRERKRFTITFSHKASTKGFLVRAGRRCNTLLGSNNIITRFQR
jgi:hypothetical protein